MIAKGAITVMKQKQISNIPLTKRELDIMNILWDSEAPKTAAMIIKAQPELTMNTVQSVLRKLLKNNFIKVADIVYSGTVLSRSYAPTISREDYILNKMTTEYQSLNKKISKTSIISAFLETEDDPEKIKQDITELKQLLDDYTKHHS